MCSSYLHSKSNTLYSIDYTEFLSKWNWDLHMIFYFHELRKYKPVNLDFAIQKVKAFLWSEKRKGFRQIKYAGIIVAVRKVSTHCHVLLVSDQNYPKRLSFDDESLIDIEIRWEHGDLLIKKVHLNKGVCGYLASDKNMDMMFPDTWSIEFFRPRLLPRLKNRTV